MTVLIIMIFLILIFLAYRGIKTFDEVIRIKFNYSFFTKKSFGIYILIYIGLFCGYALFQEVSITNADILNGILIMFFAISLFIFTLVKNINSTNYSYGIALTLLQAAIYLPLSFIGIFTAFVMFTCYSQTRMAYYR